MSFVRNVEELSLAKQQLQVLPKLPVDVAASDTLADLAS
jgi:hypothetical protein